MQFNGKAKKWSLSGRKDSGAPAGIPALSISEIPRAFVCGRVHAGSASREFFAAWRSSNPETVHRVFVSIVARERSEHWIENLTTLCPGGHKSSIPISWPTMSIAFRALSCRRLRTVGFIRAAQSLVARFGTEQIKSTTALPLTRKLEPIPLKPPGRRFNRLIQDRMIGANELASRALRAILNSNCWSDL